MTAAAWKALDKDAKAVFEERAAIEKEEYKKAIKMWSMTIKKSSPVNDPSAAQSLDCSPIPLKPPEPVSFQHQLASPRLRDDFHYATSQDVQVACVPAQEPLFQDCSQSGTCVRSDDLGPQHRVAFTPGSAQFSPSPSTRPPNMPPNDMLYSTDLGFCTSATYGSGSRADRRQSASYNLTNDAPTLHYQARYRRLSTPDYSARPSPVESVQIRSSEYQRFSRLSPNAHASFPGEKLERYHRARELSDSNPLVESRSNWPQQYVPRQPSPRQLHGHPNLPFVDAPLQHHATHLPFGREVPVQRGERRYPAPELQEVIAAAAEGPETPEEEEEMNRLLRSYEC